MQVYVFGNQDVKTDNQAILLAKKLQKDFEEVEFVFVEPNEDLPFVGLEKVVIMDVILGLGKVQVFSLESFDKISGLTRATVHDFDLGFQLKYLKKLGKIGKVEIIGIPLTGKVDYSSIQSIFKKLVAQDMQGS